MPAVESARTSGSNVGGASCIPRFRKQPRAKEFRSPACQFDATCHYEFRSCRWIITRILRASVSLNVTHYGKIKFRLSLSVTTTFFVRRGNYCFLSPFVRESSLDYFISSDPNGRALLTIYDLHFRSSDLYFYSSFVSVLFALNETI